MKYCSYKTCNRKHLALGLCHFHYNRKRNGVDMDSPVYTKVAKTNPNWRGGESKARSDGRVMAYAPNHPNAINGRYVLRYRLVMEKHLGRLLEKHEIVHHINGNPSDDRIDNLVITTQRKHARLHYLGGESGWSKGYLMCASCKSTKRRHRAFGLCVNCYKRNKGQKCRK